MSKQILLFNVSTPGTCLSRVAFTSSVKRFTKFIGISARIWTAVLLVLLCCPAPVVFAEVIEWIGPDLGNWNTDAYWSPYGCVPDAAFGEVAAINNGATVILDSPAAYPVAGVILGQTEGSSGGLEIRSGGYLQCISTLYESGDVVVGLAGQGNLTILDGGSLHTVSLSLGGAPSSFTYGSESNVYILDSLTLSATSILISQITSINYHTLSAIGTATIGGTFKPEFVDVMPTPGDSWNIIDAGVIVGDSNDFPTLDLSAAPPLPFGYVYDFVTSAGGTNGKVLQLYILEAVADLDCHGMVDFNDFARLASLWFEPVYPHPTRCVCNYAGGDGYHPPGGCADMNQDGMVDEVDLAIFINNWLDTHLDYL